MNRNNPLGNWYCVEYSVSQHYYHIETLDSAVECNLTNAIHQGNADYQIIGICRSHDEARQMIRNYQALYNLPLQSIL